MTDTARPLCDCPEPCGCYAEGYAASREYGKPTKQAKGLTSDAPAAMKATARIQRVHQVKRRCKEATTQPAVRALVELGGLDSLCHYGYSFKVILQGQSCCWTCIGQP